MRKWNFKDSRLKGLRTNEVTGGFTACAFHDMLFQCLQEAAIEAKFTEVNAVSKQKLQNLEFAQSLLNQVKYFNITVINNNNNNTI